MQRPFGYLKPLESAGDFAGVTIRTPFSKTAYHLLRTLGARPVDMNSEGIDTAVYSGFVSGTGSLPTAREQFPQGAFTAGNLAFFPKVDVVVANSAAFARLSASQQALLRSAAGSTRSKTIALTNERSAGIEFCRAGGTLVTAPPSALRALRSRASLLLASMRRNALGCASLIAPYAVVMELAPRRSWRACGACLTHSRGGLPWSSLFSCRWEYKLDRVPQALGRPGIIR